MHLWNIKHDPVETFDVLTVIMFSIEFGTETVTESPALTVFSAGAGLVEAVPNLLLIMNYQLLRHGMINALIGEELGGTCDLYDYQDFLWGL